MSLLASLTRAYDRMADRKEVPPYGYSSEKIGFLISLNEDGTPACAPIDLREEEGKKRVPRLIAVPASFKRPGVTPRSFFLWDNTAFVLGVSGTEGKNPETRLAAFRELHRNALANTDDVGLLALLRFIKTWVPEDFERRGWSEEIKDQNVVFALEEERQRRMIHERPAARSIWAKLCSGGEKRQAVCLVTGEHAPVVLVHPPIKNVRNAQSSGGSIVSFNQDAFTSYGHKQGDNAPVSEAAAFAYVAALNKFLEPGSKNRIQIGDASTVFWADATDADAASLAEDAFLAMFSSVDESVEATKVGAILAKIRMGQKLEDFEPDLAKGVRFNVLGLSPNIARLSVRFWLEDDFGKLAENYRRFVSDMRIEPPPKDPNPPLCKYLAKTAVLNKRENVPPNLAGNWMRAILTGGFYPLTLLSTVLMRLRSDKEVNALRVATLKAVLISYYNWEAPVALDPENEDPAYLLGRLFAVLEKFQTLALGKLNATIRDRYFGSASATPRNVFPMLIRLNLHHRSKAEKGEKPSLAGYFGRQLSEVMNMLPSEFPATLPLRDQGKFALGYYHQMNRRKDAAVSVEENTTEEESA